MVEPVTVLDKIISQNALIAMQRADDQARAQNQKRVTQAEMARRMTRRLFPEINEERQRDDFRAQASSVYRTLSALFKGKRSWRTDYLESFCHSLGIAPERLVAESYDDAKIPELDHAKFLSRALGRRLEPREAKRIVSNLSRAVDRPGLYDLIAAATEAILDADSAEQASGALYGLLRESPVFGRKPAPRQRKPVEEKKS